MSYSPFRHIDSVFWKSNPIQLTFFLTRRCNLRCPFCFYLSGDREVSSSSTRDNGDLTRPFPAKNNLTELSLDEIEKISSSLGKLLWLAFSGGEIFLRSDIVEITKIFYERNRPAIILFPTNGLLTDVIKEKIEEILDHCRKSTIVVKLSLEGLEDLHDSIRGVKGSFQKTIQTYRTLSALLDMYPHFDLGINTVFSSVNQDHMDELIGFVNGLEGIRTHTVSLIRGTVSDKGLKAIDSEKYHRTIDRLAANLKQKISGTYNFKGAKLKAAQDILQRRLIYNTLKQKKQLIPCYAGRLNLVLTETGEVYPCESFTMGIGNVRDNNYDLVKILKNDKAQKYLRSIQDKDCYCTHECYFMTNILFNPSMYPALLKEYIQL
jgi:radical SAM protein with 4Fe4S-binding SPASM domain